MRKLLIWLLAALMALACLCPAIAETTDAVNGSDAVNTGSDLYIAVPADGGMALVRVPLSGGSPVCVDRGGEISDILPYSSGIAYLKKDNGATAIMGCKGNTAVTLYSFGAQNAGDLSYYGGKFLALIDGLLYSVEPESQLCLKLSGAQMSEYVVDDGCAYYVAMSDQLDYTADLGNGQTATGRAGCIYRLDLASGETELLLKSGATDLKLNGHFLYFHNLSSAYAVQSSGGAVQALINRGFIEECGRRETLGRPMLYGTTDAFLRHFGIEDLSQLPSVSLDAQNHAPGDDAAPEPKGEEP